MKGFIDCEGMHVSAAHIIAFRQADNAPFHPEEIFVSVIDTWGQAHRFPGSIEQFEAAMKAASA